MPDDDDPPAPHVAGVARLVGSGFAAPHARAASAPALEVRYDALPSWLADRRLLSPDWQAQAAKAAASVAGVVADLPAGVVAGVVAGDPAAAPPPSPSTTTTWTYARCLALRAALVDGGHTSRTLLGGLAGPAGTVDAAVRAYERSGAAAAAPALALSSLLDCELPALRASLARGASALADLARRAADSRRAAVAAAAAHAERCAKAGVPAVPGAGELRAALGRLPAAELPGLLGGVAAALRGPGVGEAMGYYAAFTAALHGPAATTPAATPPDAAPPTLPALAALRSADLAGDGRRLGGGGAAAAVTPAPPATPNPGGGGDADAWGITTVAGGEGAPGEEEGEGEGEQPGTGTTPAPSSTSMPSHLARLADDPAARAALGDDLAELTAFLRQRAAEAGSATAAAAAARAGAPPPVSVALLDDWSGVLASALAALTSPRARLLYGLRAGALEGAAAGGVGGVGGGAGTAAARVLADLESGARAEARHRAAAAAADARAAAVQAGVEADRAALARAIARARAAVVEAEAGAAARLGNGQRVVLVGSALESL